MIKSCFIISNCRESSESIDNYLNKVCKLNINYLQIPSLYNLNKQNILSYYHSVCSLLHKYPYTVLRESIVIFDHEGLLSAEELDLNPMDQDNLLSSLVGMFILSFPELHWIFPYYIIPNEIPNYSGLKYLKASHKWFWLDPLNDYINKIKFSPLFDGNGIREEIKYNSHQINKDEPFVDRRFKLSTAIEDEESYAYLNGYYAYKLGYRAYIILNENMMKKLFDKNNKEIKIPLPKVDITFEDMYLNFPDRVSNGHLSDLEERDEKYKGLKDVSRRILITVGHKKVEWYKKNIEYIKRQRLSGKVIKIIYKPSGGIYNVIGSCGRQLLKDYWSNLEKRWKYSKRSHIINKLTSHSAPGRILTIADTLLTRSRNILNSKSSEALTVMDCIQAATLAMEAKELLQNRTPTTSLEALALQHEAEIIAESMFCGVEYNLNMNDRMKDIKLEVKAISEWFNPKSKKRSEINALLNISERLAKRFREMNQFEEEQACLAEARNLRFEFWMRQKPWRWAAWPLLKYIEQALYSLTRFFLIILGWIILFGVIYYFMDQTCGGRGGFIEAFTASMRPFFAAEPSREWVDMRLCLVGWNLLKSFQGLVSLFNLTLLIAHIYLIVSRR